MMKMHCLQLGAYLVEINDPSENTWITQNLLNNVCKCQFTHLFILLITELQNFNINIINDPFRFHFVLVLQDEDGYIVSLCLIFFFIADREIILNIS